MKNQKAQNASVAQASILWCNHPKQLNHQALHDCLMVLEQSLLDIPMKYKNQNKLAQKQDIQICTYS